MSKHDLLFYLKQYSDAIGGSKAIKASTSKVVSPSIWIYFKWSEDAGYSPDLPREEREALHSSLSEEMQLVVDAGEWQVFDSMGLVDEEKEAATLADARALDAELMAAVAQMPL